MLRAIKKKFKRSKKDLLHVHLPQLFYRSRVLSSLYYVLFNSSFNRENHAVLAGKVKHIKEAVEVKSNYFLLVRNTHRLEKGLLMRPRRDVFATEFIAETVDSYIGVMSLGTNKNSPQLKWFTDVLTEYFKICKSHPVVDTQRIRFLEAASNCTTANEGCSGSISVPHYRNVSLFSNISYDEFYKLNKQRRSVRWFIDKPVERELIDKAILAAIQAPSA